MTGQVFFRVCSRVWKWPDLPSAAKGFTYFFSNIYILFSSCTPWSLPSAERPMGVAPLHQALPCSPPGRGIPPPCRSVTPTFFPRRSASAAPDGGLSPFAATSPKPAPMARSLALLLELERFQATEARTWQFWGVPPRSGLHSVSNGIASCL